MNFIRLVTFASVSLAMTMAPSALATKQAAPLVCADLDCFLKAAKTCTQAKINPQKLGFSRSEQLEIRGVQNERCLYYAQRSPIQKRGFACQFYNNDGLVTWLEMISRRRRVIYDSRQADSSNVKDIGQRTIETINGEDVAECLWR